MEEEIVVDIKLEEEKNDPPKVSRRGALKLITPLQLLSCQCKRKLLPSSFHDLLHVGPLHAIDYLLHTSSLWPDAWTTVADVWQLPFSGHCHHVAEVIL